MIALIHSESTKLVCIIMYYTNYRICATLGYNISLNCFKKWWFVATNNIHYIRKYRIFNFDI